MTRPRCAVIGAGPIGIEAALEARARGHEVTVFEAGRVGEHLRRFGWVRLFTPFRMSAGERGRALLREAGVALPDDDDLLTAGEMVARYLEPLARLLELRGALREGTRVTHVGRAGMGKTQGIIGVDERARARAPFLLRVARDGADPSFEEADLVIDASGTYGTANATGPGGLPAVGEETLGASIERHIPDVLDADRERYEGARLLLVGDGHSAATALLALQELHERRSGEAVHWITRRTDPAPVQELPDDPLPARRALASRANAITRTASWLRRYPGATIRSYRRGDRGGIAAQIRTAEGASEMLHVDRILALVGYRPDVDLFRELRIQLCYASEGTMALASAILKATAADPGAAGDCLSQEAHGPETLRNPEPGFYVLGAKSYGRNPNFILAVGYRQVRDAFDLIEADQARAASATS